MTEGESLVLNDANEFIRQTANLLDEAEQSTGIRPHPVIEESETVLETTRFGMQFAPEPLAESEPGSSTPAPTTPTGACCLPDGSCFVDTHTRCTAFGGSYQGDNEPCTPNPCPCSCPPGCTSYPISVTVTINCDTGTHVCHCTGTTDWISPTQCQFNGGCNLGDCGDIPVVVDLRWYGGDWHIKIFTNSGIPPDNLCSVDESFGTNFSGDNYVFLVTGCSPSGTYAVDLDNGDPMSSATCHVDIIIIPELVYGACCCEGGSCTDNIERSACVEGGCNFLGACSTCAGDATGACCVDGTCFDVQDFICTILGGTFHGVCSTCEHTSC